MKINSWGGPKTRGDCTIKEEIASVPLQLSKKGLWIKETFLSPRRRLITKALNRMHGKLGIASGPLTASVPLQHIWWGRWASIHEGVRQLSKE